MSGLRITGGEKRGRKLFSPPADTIRPASDMIRQAVFNMLQHEITGSRFYDIFAGTGVVGIEAISRGAERAIFVERDRKQLRLLERNIAHVGVEASSEVRLADAYLWSRHFTPGPEPTIVFLGPPYEKFTEDELTTTMDLVRATQERMRDEDILVLQFDSSVADDALPDRECWYRVRRYGKTKVGLWSKGASHSSEPAIDDIGESPADDPAKP